MKDIKDFLPRYREVNTILVNAVNNGKVTYPDQCLITDFCRECQDIKTFENMILDLILHTEDKKYSLLLSNLQNEVENTIKSYESGKDILESIDIHKLCDTVASRFDDAIKTQSEITGEYRREINQVNGSLDAIGFREHTKEEEQRLWREYERLTKLYDHEREKLNSLYTEQENLRREVGQYNSHLFLSIYNLSRSHLSILKNYTTVQPTEESAEPISEPESKPFAEINPNEIFRTKMFERFRELEIRLIKDGDLDDSLNWLPKHKNSKSDIKRLVTFMTALIDNNYFLPNRDSSIKAFFESRYRINIGQNFERKRREPLLAEYKAVFYDYSF